MRLATGGPIDGFDDYRAAVEAAPTDPVDAQLGGLMLYTSGTTGHPKGVAKAPGNAVADLLNVNFVEPGDPCLITGPLYHAAPLTFGLIFSLQWGAPLVVMPTWDAAEALRLIETHGVTHVHFVPTMFHRLLALPDEVRAAADVSSLTRVHHGAAPCPVHVKHEIIEWFGPIIYEYYASTEGGGSNVDSETWLTRPGTVGQPAEGSVVIGTDAAPTTVVVSTPMTEGATARAADMRRACSWTVTVPLATSTSKCGPRSLTFTSVGVSVTSARVDVSAPEAPKCMLPRPVAVLRVVVEVSVTVSKWGSAVRAARKTRASSPDAMSVTSGSTRVPASSPARVPVDRLLLERAALATSVSSSIGTRGRCVRRREGEGGQTAFSPRRSRTCAYLVARDRRAPSPL